MFSILSILLTTTLLYAQSPESFSYQTVIRDGNWEVISDQNVGIKISILEDSPNGSIAYQEFHDVTTNNIGLVNLAIGEGNAVSGDFSLIDWGSHAFFIEVALDIDGGANYQVMGVTQLRSVPYALYAKNSGTPGPPGPAGSDGQDGADGA